MIFHFIALAVGAGDGVAAISAGNLRADSSAVRVDGGSASSGVALPPSDAGGQDRKRFFRREDVQPGSIAEASDSPTVDDQSGRAFEKKGRTRHKSRASKARWSAPAVPSVLAETGAPSGWRGAILNKIAGETTTPEPLPIDLSALEHGQNPNSSGQEDSQPQVFEVTVVIGKSNLPEKCIHLSQPLACPKNAADRDIRKNQERTSESFDITVSGSRTVCAKRIDKVDGWSMNLEITCNKQAAVTVHMGTNPRPKKSSQEKEKATKCLLVFPAVSCTWNAANYGIRGDDGSFSEDGSFFVESLAAGKSFSQSRVCVTRLDGDSYWDLDLQFSCNVLDQFFVYNAKAVLNRANPSKNMFCTTLEERTDMVTCPTNAGEWDNRGSTIGIDYEVVVNYAFTAPESGSRICTRRTDMPDGWDGPFNLVCASRGMIRVGASPLYKQKCVTVDQPIVCTPAAANREFRLNDDGSDDKGDYDVSVDGSTLCVRRKDRAEGWTMDLLIACNPALGYSIEAISDKGLPTVQASSRRRREHWLALVEDPIDANLILDGMVIWLEHAQHKWLACTGTECVVDRQQSPDLFRIFTEGKQANVPLMNGATVYLRHERSTNYMYCDQVCEVTSQCPIASNVTTDFSLCQNERFKIYSSAGQGAIRDGDTIWLQHSSLKYLMCPSRAEPCLVDGVCPVSWADRSFMKEDELARCRGERFRIYMSHMNQKEKQAMEVVLGPSEAPEKCVLMMGDSLTCAKNAGNAPFRDKYQNTYDEDPVYEISVSGSLELETAWQICARRVDKGEGWRMNLVISCNRKLQSPQWPHDLPAFTASVNNTNSYLLPALKRTNKYISSKTRAANAEEAVAASIPHQLPLAPAPAGPPGPPGSAGPPGPPGVPAPPLQETGGEGPNGQPTPPPAVVPGLDPTTGAISRNLNGTRGCWRPHVECKLPFAHKQRWYMGCVEDVKLGSDSAFCGLKQIPNEKKAADFKACDLVACDEVCWKPSPECIEPFFYQHEHHSGCIPEGNQAWCSKVSEWQSSSLTKGDWSWCEPVDCNGACWQPSSSCVMPFSYNSMEHSGCVEHESGGAWCSFKQTINAGEPDWAWCRQSSCDTALEGHNDELEYALDMVVVNQVTQQFQFTMFNIQKYCTGGTRLFASNDGLGACATKCRDNLLCNSFQFNNNSECSACVLTSSDCQTVADSTCDGTVVSFLKAASNEGSPLLK